MNKLADYDNVSGIGDIAGKVIESGVNSVISSANDTVKNILNLDNSKNKNDNNKKNQNFIKITKIKWRYLMRQ